MLYIIANKQKAAEVGISPLGHRVNGDHIIVNEKELNYVPGDTLEERAGRIDGRVYDAIEIKKLIIKGDW
ncbi:MAG: hypothetical protein J6N54_05175 [Bacteroidales bacterium]|nr:hypothetical protein [Bacteroidales bacterium]